MALAAFAPALKAAGAHAAERPSTIVSQIEPSSDDRFDYPGVIVVRGSNQSNDLRLTLADKRHVKVEDARDRIGSKDCDRRGRHVVVCRIPDYYELDAQTLSGDDTIRIDPDIRTGELNSVRGGGGRDRIFGGRDDSIDGGSGRDLIVGGIGSDYISGDKGRDTERGGRGNDSLGWDEPDQASDVFRGGPGQDVIDARDGRTVDEINCGSNPPGTYNRDEVRPDRADLRAKSFKHCELVRKDLLRGGDDMRPRLGVVAQGPITPNDMAALEEAGADSLRIAVEWRAIEYLPGQYNWSVLDPVVLMAARHGVDLLPYTSGSPAWMHADWHVPPVGSSEEIRDAASFQAALVERYGPGGDLWRGRATRRPIREWQVGNEPNLAAFWPPAPNAKDYASLLEASATAIRGVDSHARVLLAGLAPTPDGQLPWRFLARLYRVPGIKRSFDSVALHPYARSPQDLDPQINRARRVMRRAGDGSTPVEISELGWSSDQRGALLIESPLDQAWMLRSTFAELTLKQRDWNIRSAYWYALRDTATPPVGCGFCSGAGLLGLDGDPKPSFDAFRRLAGPRK